MSNSYDLIATLGPSTATLELWRALLEAGATAFRLNTSHLTLSDLSRWLDRLATLPACPPLVLDLQGSKWRLGECAARVLDADQVIDLVLAATTDQPDQLPVPHADFFQAAAQSSAEIVLNDAKLVLKREVIAPDHIRARVVRGGPIAAHKGLTYADSTYRQTGLSDKDRAIFTHTQAWPEVRYALSYVRDGEEMRHYRAHFGPAAYLIAKLERRPAMADARRIAASADEVWVCRGDLGAEVGLRDMAASVYAFSHTVQALPIPAIMAGQVLEHMTEHATPTRSEVCYLHDTLRLGYRGFVLSDEVAIGHYPIESVRTAAQFRA